MKRTMFLVMLVMLAGIAGAAVNTQYIGKAPNILVALASQDPDPVEPGREVEVAFKLDNNGTTAKNVVFEIIPEYPFSLVPGEPSAKQVGVLETSQGGKQSVVVRYKLKVAQDAPDGSHDINARYKSDSYDSWTTLENFKIKVQSHDAILAVDKFTADPSVVAPGSKTKLTILLKNYATSLLKDVKVSLDLGKSGDEATPFSPLDSTNEKVISYIEPQSVKPIEFELIADPGAVSKSYKIPLSIRYSDALNKNYSKSNIITVIVGGQPDVSVYIEGTTIYSAGSAGEITVKIVNKGSPDMKFVNVRLAKDAKYKILSPAEVYIGNIDSDDYETADFRLYIEKVSENNVALPLAVEYKDANNKDYKSTVNLELPLYTDSEAKKLGLVEGNGNFSWLLVVVVLIAGFFGYRAWKKRRKHN